MLELLQSAATWWLGTVLCGGSILLAACLLMHSITQPALRQRLGELSVLAALAVAVLRLGPAWLSIPWPASQANAAPPDTLTVSYEIASLPPLLPAAAGVGVEMPPSAFIESKALAFRTPEDSTDEPVATDFTTTGGGWGWQHWAAGITALYLATVGVLVLRWLLGQWALGRMLRQGRPASSRVRKLFTLMAAGTVWPLPLLRLSRRLRVPVCFGLRRPAVLLPELLEHTADETALRWVFAHELTHLRRRDPWSYWALGLAQAVYFYLPWYWWLRRQVRLCQEYIADAAAAREGDAADEYAAFLVSLAKRPATPLGATGLGSSSDLMRRVQMLLQSTTRVQGNCSRRWSLLTAGALFGFAVVLSGVGVQAQQPDNAKKDEQKKEMIILNQDDLKNVTIILDKLNADILKVVPTELELTADIIKLVPADLQVTADVLKLVPADVLKLVPVEMNMVVKLIDEPQAKKQDGDQDGQPEKKVQRVVIVIDVNGKQVTIPIDGDMSSDKIKAAIERAMAEGKKQAESGEKTREQTQAEREKAQAAREKAQAAREKAQAEREKALEQARVAREKAQQQAKVAREKAQAERRQQEVTGEKGQADREKAAAELKKKIDTLQQALKGLDKDLGEDQVKALMKKLEELKASKVDVGAANQRATDAVRRAVEAKVQPRIATGTGAAVGNMIAARANTSRLGVRFEKPNATLSDQLDLPRNQGLVIVDVQKDSAAAKAGLKVNDILLEVDGKTVSSDAAAFARQLQEIKSDDAVNAVVLRKGKKVRIREITLPEAKGPEGAGAFNFQAFPGAGGTFNVVPGVNALELKLTPPTLNVVPAIPKLPAPSKAPPAPKAPATPRPPTAARATKTEKSETEKSANTSVTVEIKDGQFKAVQKEGDTTITVTGKVNEGKVEVSIVTVQDGDNRSTYRNVDRVPEKYRDKVKKLISNAPDSPIRFEYRKSDGDMLPNANAAAGTVVGPVGEQRSIVTIIDG